MSSETNNNNRSSSIGFFGIVAVLSAICVIGSSIWLKTNETTYDRINSSAITVTEEYGSDDKPVNAAVSTEAHTEENPAEAAPRKENLILINADNPIPEDYETELTVLSNGIYVASEIYPDLQAMFDDMRSQNIHPIVGEGYRTREQQQRMMDDKILSFQNSGYSYEQAVTEAKKWVALPGTSEHELGLAVDINADYALSSNEAVYQWLDNYAHCYGFILRYPADKAHITGIDYEPWHYRWVGREAAQEIYSSGLCLEEYLETIS